MFKTIATSVVMFLALFCASAFGQGHVPTLGSNNNWTGTNNFVLGHLSLGTEAQQCTSPQVQAGFQADFTPICVTVSGGGGTTTVNGLSDAVNVTNTDTKFQISTSGQNLIINCSGCLTTAVNTLGVFGGSSVTGNATLQGDSNVTVTLTGQNFQLHCPGCGGSGGTPAGGTGAIQFNNSGSFGGTVVTGMVKSSASGPVAAIPDSDFALPFTLSCGTGLSCPKAGENYAFTLTGSAGTGAVAAAVNGQMGGYSATGTTIGGAPNIYSLNAAWNVSQITGLMSRFAGVLVTGWSLTSNVVTVQGVNAFNAGEAVDMVFFASGTPFLNNFVTILSAGLSNSQFEFSFSHADVAFSNSQGYATFNVPAQPLTSQGLVIIPPGLIDNPSSAFVNVSLIGPAAQVLDWRKGYGLQQMSAYGVKCDMQQLFVTLHAGSDLVTVGSDFSSMTQPLGMTLVSAIQPTFGNGGTQADFETTIIAYPYPNIQLATPSPYDFTGNVLVGTNNQAALQRAMNDVGGGIPLWLPQCQMLTDTLRWNGANLLGGQMNSTSLNGFPAHDLLQQQDTLPITAWSINTSTGVTTFTIPAYSSHSILPSSLYPVGSEVSGDVISLQGFPTATFFNNQNVTIATQPTPTTFTVNGVFGQSTSSGSDHGKGVSTTSASTNALRVENSSYNVHQGIDGSYSWIHYDGTNSAVSTVEPPYYRPGMEFNQPMNDPRAPGWGVGQSNGVATITQNTGVICAPTASGARLPVVGQTIIFPYQGAGLKSFTVASTAGSCSAGFTPFTLGSYKGGPTTFPNTSAFTATQASWWTYTTPQTLAFALPSTISYPFNLYMNLPFPPVPGYEANVSSHGHIIINGDEFDYMGDNFGGTASSQWPITSVTNASAGSTVYTGNFSFGGFSCVGNPVLVVTGFSNAANNGTFTCTASTGTTMTLTNAAGVAQTQNATVASPPPTIVLRGGPTSINSGAGDAIGSVIFPLNPCQAMYHNPWPVVPTINSGQATPVNAVYYAGICGAEAAMSFPESDGLNTTFNGSGMSLAFFNNVGFNALGQNGLGNTDSNGSIAIYEQANLTGYGNTFDNLRIVGTWAGVLQGPAAVNQHGVRAIGPTSTGQSWTNCTIRSGYGFTIVSMQQSNMDRCDTYSTEVSQYDGTVVGASTGLFIGYTVSEQDGGGITGVGQFTVKDYNNEPENGNHEEFMPSVVSDGTNITWIGDIFEGGYNIFGGQYQHIFGTQMSVPIFNYGSNNYFDNLYGLTLGSYDNNVYNGTSQFYNWGQNSTCQGTTGTGGPQRTLCVGAVQSYNGHDAWATMFGNVDHPTENLLGGMITPGEWATSGFPVVFDSTELWWGQHSECSMNPSNECIAAQFDGFGGYLYIGPHQRIVDSTMVMKASVRLKNAGTMTFRIMYSGQNPGNTSCVPNFSLAPATFTVTSSGWTAIQQPVNFTGLASCVMEVQFDSASATNVLEIGYFNFVPFASQLYMPLGTPTEGAACPVAGEFKLDAVYEWLCHPTSGAAFGAGIWGRIPIT